MSNRSDGHIRASIALGPIAAAILMVHTLPAQAAEAEPDEAFAAPDRADAASEIMVTARRREESAQDVPVALSVISGGTLERTGNFTLNQIQQLAPSLQIAATNPRNSSINIRGLGANSAVAVDGLEYGVGFYVDGVYYGRPGQSQFDLIDLERVEILRGPQGTLFGKNTTAGAINITSRLPTFTPELTAEASLGNYGYHQLRVSGSLPIIADKVAARLSIADTHRDGFLTNRFTGKDAQNYKNFTARGQLLVKPVNDVTIRLIGDYASQKQAAILNVIDGYFSTYANNATIPNNIFDRAARTGYVLPTRNAFSRTGDSNSPFQANMKSYGFSGELNWDLGPATLTSITALRRWNWHPENDVDGLPLSINTRATFISHQRQFSQELRLASNGQHTIDYVAGLFYFSQQMPANGEVTSGSDFAAWNLNPATVPAGTIALINSALSGLSTRSYSDARTKSYAAFGQIDWHLAEALTLTAGLRYTHEDKAGVFRRFLSPVSGGDRGLLSSGQQAAYQVNDIDFSTTVKSDAVSGLATLSYKPTPDLLFYGTYSHGSKSGGLNVTAGGVGRPVIAPESVDSFEIGFKSQLLDRRLTLNAAAFRTDVSDYQTNVSEQIVGSTQTLLYISNIPKVRSQGVEADLGYAVTRLINVGASAAYTDAKFVRFDNSPQSPENSNIGGVQNLSGRALPGISKFVWTLNLDATQPISDDARLYFRGDWLHRSAFNSMSTLSIYGKVPAYGLLNAKVGVQIAALDLSIWARNLLDKDYYIGRSAGTFGLINATTGDPRTYGITARINW